MKIDEAIELITEEMKYPESWYEIQVDMRMTGYEFQDLLWTLVFEETLTI